MEDKRWPKPITTWPPEGRRRRGRLEVTWDKEVKKNLIIVQQDATYSVYYISVGSSICFGCWHPSSGAGTAVIIASGID